ncbi:MAG TPA: hypothetical protein VMY37_04310 [Thermoguttaceae bacterium]|nr:hypothetical protein [Thermoguttaceae bacterium]
MTLSYDHLFSDIGQSVEAIDDIHALAKTTFPAMADEIHDELIDETNKGDGLTPAARYDILSGFPEMFAGFQDTLVSWIGDLAAKISESLTDVDLVLQETSLPLDGSATVDDVLREFYRKMIDDTESVDASILSICGADQDAGTATADASNQGTGKVFVTRILDGYAAPSSGFSSLREYAYDIGNDKWPGEAGYVGTESQLGVTAETMTLTCSSDSETDGAAEGGESFDLIGGVAGNSLYDWESEGSGRGPNISAMNQSGLLTDGEFENWTKQNGNYHPTNWTVDAGGTKIDRSEDEVAGTYALEFTGDGAVAAYQISQDVTSLTPLKRYCVACWVKGQAGIAVGALTIQFEGTGYTAGTNEKITMDAAALAAQVAYGEEYFFVTMPTEIPTDMELVVKITGILTDTKLVLIDRLAIGEVTWHGGVGIAILAGSAPFLRADRFTFAVANDNAGTFQSFFRRWYGLQLPSNSAAGETILDAWAE